MLWIGHGIFGQLLVQNAGLDALDMQPALQVA